MGCPALKDLQQWFKDHQPAGPGTSGSKVGCVSMVSVGEPWGRAHASAEEVGWRIPSGRAGALRDCEAGGRAAPTKMAVALAAGASWATAEAKAAARPAGRLFGVRRGWP